MRSALNNYLHHAITRDWPWTAAEEQSGEVPSALNELYARTLALAATGSRQQAAAARPMKSRTSQHGSATRRDK
jgi:hypothetical protein